VRIRELDDVQVAVPTWMLELADRARQVGFTRVVVIDDDLGVSGTGRQTRPGFGWLLTAVCEGTVGAVLALEASRLARNESRVDVRRGKAL
jgi:DNA invertase Pin-like site-specific DNA recombinase